MIPDMSEDVAVHIIFGILMFAIPALPIVLTVIFFFVFFLLISLPRALYDLLCDNLLLLSLYLYAMFLSWWRSSKFDMFKTAHRYDNGEHLYDNTANVGDEAYVLLKEKPSTYKGTGDSTTKAAKVIDVSTSK